MATQSKPADLRRSARINLAFTAELKKKLEDIAALDEVSTNALVEKICLEYVETREADLAEYQQFRARIREKNDTK